MTGIFAAISNDQSIYGSSGITGESRPDFEEEVVGVAEFVCHSLDDLDLVVDALEQACVERPSGVGEDAGQVFFELSGEGDEGLDAAFERALEPAFSGGPGVLFGAVAP